MAYDVIFMDVDNTILDFDAGTYDALTALLGDYGLPMSQAELQRFLTMNNELWGKYERGEIEKAEIFPTRFRRFLGTYGIETDYHAANARYAEVLKQSAVFLPHAQELLAALRGKYRIFAVTNGVTKTQLPRLEKAGLLDFFEQVFISEEMGCKKPERAFFDKVFDSIGDVDKSRCIILGDSLTSDMQGGRNAGITTCLLGKPTDDPRCDYVIGDLLEFLEILQR